MDFVNRPWSREDSPEKEEKEKKEKEPKSKLEEKFLETRTILLYGEISQKSAREVSEKLILLSSINSDDIKLIINSPLEDRYSLPNTRFMLHQPSGGVGGQASDISIEAQEILKMRERLNKIFSVQTGQPVEKIERDTDRNFWMSADEAKQYGLVGKVISSQSEY
jgi:ATP-dependent Clp protease protease subunit